MTAVQTTERQSVRTVSTRRWWLLGLEVLWYVLVVVLLLTAVLRNGYRPHERTEYQLLFVLACVLMLVALARWWAPRWTGPAAIIVLVVGIVVVVTLPSGSLGPIRQVLSCAVEPVLIAAAVRRGDRWTAPVVCVLAVIAALVDVFHGGAGSNSLSADLARALSPPSPGQRTLRAQTVVLVVVASLQAMLPTAVGLLMRSVDTASRDRLLTQARTEERLQVARELHDMVANHVTGIVVTAQAAGMASDRPEVASRALNDIEAAGHRALDAMQRMVTALRSAGLVDPASPVATGLDEPPDATVSAVEVVRGVVDGDPAVALHLDATLTGADGIEPPGRPAPPEIAATLDRVVTEALTNARRHLPDHGGIEVTLSAPARGWLGLEVTNDCRAGGGRLRGSGFGLVGLRERVDAVGGVLTAGPTTEHRWRLRADLPHDPTA